MRRLVAAYLTGLVLVLPVSCGGSASSPLAPQELGPFGTGADIYWLWRAHDKPRAVVVFLHGLDRSELNPTNHLPWLEHLAEQGDDVVYPMYEVQPGERGAIRHTLSAVDVALQRLGRPAAPMVVVGYSRGGRLAVEFSAIARAIQAIPAAVMSIFPSQLNPVAEERIDLRTLESKTRIMLVVGEEDSRDGARELLQRLRDASFPARNVEAVVIRSRGSFHADHFSPLQSGPEVQRQLWAPLDRLIDGLER